jgi:hypothetical protein
MLDQLKKARDAAKRKLAQWRAERDRKRKRAREKKKQRKELVARRREVAKRARHLERQYDEVEPYPGESDEAFQARAFELKSRAVGLRREEAELRERSGRLHKLIRRVLDGAKDAARHARWYATVRLPKIRRAIEDAREAFDPMGSRIVSFDGKPVAEWLAYRLEAARRAGWGGGLNSGWRSPEYSEQLCYQICGAPTCPGRCAGKTSNHTKNVYPEGAIDVSDPANFAAVMRQLANRIPGVVIFNALGNSDPWHMSASGR